MSYRILFASCAAILLSSMAACHDPKDVILDSSGVAISLTPRWRTAVNAGSHLAYGVETAISYGNGVLCPGVIPYASKEPYGRAVLNFIDAETGKIQWTWNDYITDFENSYIKYPYQYGRYLVVNGGPRNYCIDLSTGKTLWKRWMNDSLNARSTATGIGNLYFVAASAASETNPAAVEEVIYKGEIVGNEVEQRVVRPDVSGKYVSPNKQTGGASAPTAVEVNGDTLLSVAYSDLLPNYVLNSFLGLYNLTKKQWIYSKAPLPVNRDRGPDNPSVYANGRIYQAVGGVLTCNELMTGKPVWDKQFNGDFTFSGYFIVDNLLVANCGDGFLYGLDPATGSEVWKEKSSGSSTRLYYQNGVVYFAGGGDGLLHAVEVATGKHLWKLQSPDLKQDSRAFYQGMVAGIAGQGTAKGTIIANTGRNIYAYSAAK